MHGWLAARVMWQLNAKVLKRLQEDENLLAKIQVGCHARTTGRAILYCVPTRVPLLLMLQDKLLGPAKKPIVRESPIGIVNVNIL